MRACESALVTLKLPFFDVDMELPTFLSLGELSKKILETLRLCYPSACSGTFEMRISYNGAMLAETDTLASRGIWDGSVLACELM